MFIFANFKQNFDFVQSQFQRIGAALTEFCLFKVPLLPVLAESCFKAPKVTLHKNFYR